MRLSYELDGDDYLDLNVTHVLGSPVVRRSLTLQRWLVPLAALAYFGLSEREYAAYAGVFAVAWFVLFPVGFRRAVRRKVRADIARAPRPSLGARTLHVDETGLVEEGVDGWRACYRWDEVERIEESARAVIVFASGNRAVVVPKRWIVGEHSVTEVLRSLVGHLAAAAPDGPA